MSRTIVKKYYTRHGRSGGSKSSPAMTIAVLGGVGIIAYLLLKPKDAAAAGGAGGAGGTGGAGGGGTGGGGGGGTPAVVPPGGGTDAKTGLRYRTIDASTGTPGNFAVKWGGSFAKWKELAKVNPSMRVVDQPADCSGGKVASPADPDATPGYKDAAGIYCLPYYGIVPWSLGQKVLLPADWPG